MEKTPTIIITGSSGFIGSYFTSRFSEDGFKVRAFQRKIPPHRAGPITYYSFNLSEVKDEGFNGADYLIHCAYQPNPKDLESDINISAAKKIISLARKYNIKIVYFSSMSAHPGAESKYGRHKLAAEKLFDSKKDLILKPGFVIGAGGGLFGKIASFIKHHKIIPLVGGGNQLIQIIALDDLYLLTNRAIKKGLTGTFALAYHEPVRLKELYKEIAKNQGAKPIFVHIPLPVVYWGMRLIECLGIYPPITSENLLGLKMLKTYGTAGGLKTIGAAVKDYQMTLKNL